MLYHHTQRGRLILGFAIVGGVAMVGALLTSRRPLLLLPLLPIVAFSAVLSRLTIEVDVAELRHHFGLGVWRKRVPIDEIVEATQTTSSWAEGWGIRVTIRGMLYNVAGRDAVEIRLRSGRRFRLGTDEPEVLLAALRQAGVPTATAA